MHRLNAADAGRPADGGPRAWIGAGALHVAEHMVTRVADALLTLLLVRSLAPERFAVLADAQAWIAPLLFVFLSPDAVLIRDHAAWTAEGPDVLWAKQRAFRRFAWGKAAAAVVLSAVVAALWDRGTAAAVPTADRFFATLWAFALVLTAQVTAPDREILRLRLRFRTLNAVALVQKAMLLGGTAGVLVLAAGRVDLLAAVAVGHVLVTAAVLRAIVRRELPKPAVRPVVSARSTIASAVWSFSLWQHLAGATLLWVTTMDLWWLPLAGVPERTRGAYATALKLSNFAAALPLAFQHFHMVWTSRTSVGPDPEASRTSMLRAQRWFVAGCVLQALPLYVFREPLLRWVAPALEPAELARAAEWTGWIVTGTTLVACTHLATAWLMMRTSGAALFLRVHLPWGIVSLGLYGAAAFSGGPDLAARANVASALVLVALTALHLRTARPEART